MYLKAIPERTCIGCNEKKQKKELIRIVKDKEGNQAVSSEFEGSVYKISTIFSIILRLTSDTGGIT